MAVARIDSPGDPGGGTKVTGEILGIRLPPLAKSGLPSWSRYSRASSIGWPHPAGGGCGGLLAREVGTWERSIQ
jgi:hypothetical protein